MVVERIEDFVRILFSQFIADSVFGTNDEFFAITLCYIIDDTGSAANIICFINQILCTFRMNYEFSTRMFCLGFQDFFLCPCGTGSEVTNISIINRVSRGVKMGLVSPAMFADSAALITNMLDTLPYKVFATSSIDAMVHSIESFLSPNGCSISRVFSKAALETIVKSWKKAVTEGGGEAWKKYEADFLKASNWAGLAFGYAGCAAVHAMAYPLGSVYHIPHGQSNQLMFADTMRKYKELQPVGRINELEELLAGYLDTTPDKALDALYALLDQVLLAEPLRNFGVKESDLPVFAHNVIETQQRLLRNNYVPLSEEQILEVYKAAF